MPVTIFMIRYLISFICFLVFFGDAFSEIRNITNLEDLKNISEIQESNFIINKPIKINEDIYIPKNITLSFVEDGKLILDESFKLTIDGKISKTSKQIFLFTKNTGFKNLLIKDDNFDVRWFGDPADEISQMYSSYHGKTMFFDEYVIDTSYSFLYSNIKAYFNNTLITGTLHFSDYPADKNKKYIENINIDGKLKINGRLGGLYGKNIFINEVLIAKSENYRPAGVHIYSGVENLRINKLIIEDSIRHYALGIDSHKISLMPKDIFIKEVIIKDSFVHGAFINGINIQIDRLIIESFGNIRKSQFIDEMKKNLNFPLKFKYLDLFEVAPKGLVIGYGSNIKLNKVLIKTKNYSIIDFYNFFRIKKFLVQPAIFFADFTNQSQINDIEIEIPQSIKISNKIIFFLRDNIILKIFRNFEKKNYIINNNISNIWPFEIEKIN